MIEPHAEASHRGRWESLLRRIPGFRGYLEREDRRESDYRARRWMADRLRDGKLALDRFQQGLLAAGLSAALPGLERVRVRLDLLANKVVAEPRGAGGLFDFVRVDSRLLEEIYACDLRLAEELDRLVRSIEQLGVKADLPQAVATDLLFRLDQFASQFQRRDQLLSGTA